MDKFVVMLQSEVKYKMIANELWTVLMKHTEDLVDKIKQWTPVATSEAKKHNSPKTSGKPLKRELV